MQNAKKDLNANEKQALPKQNQNQTK